MQMRAMMQRCDPTILRISILKSCPRKMPYYCRVIYVLYRVPKMSLVESNV